MFELTFTKFLDVKSPLGIDQSEETKDCLFDSVGIDIFMPNPTIEFINSLTENNKFTIAEINYDVDVINEFKIRRKNSQVILHYREGKYYIYRNIHIPSGIGILIPKGYHVDLRSKSSNFKNEYTSITGLIDENFTYGMGVQINVLTKYDLDSIVIQPKEKFAQMVLIKSNLIKKMNEISNNEWDNLEEVKNRRITRTGGFGSKGKF